MKPVLFFFLCLSGSLSAQVDSVAFKLAQQLSAATLKEHVYQLASTEFEGRETGTEGNTKAANYIADELRKSGVLPLPGTNSYFQKVTFSQLKWSSISLDVDGTKRVHVTDYLCIPRENPERSSQLHVSSLLYLGYGIDEPSYSEYNGVDVVGKDLLVFSGEPHDKSGLSMLTGTDSLTVWSNDIYLKAEAAARAGASSIWIVDSHFAERARKSTRQLSGGEMEMGTLTELTQNKIPTILLSPELAETILGGNAVKVKKMLDKSNRKRKPAHLVLPVDLTWNATHEVKSTESQNVLGYIEGTDPARRNEIVVVSAHYDHLGKRGNDIYFGADDNASGSSAILEIAKAMATAKANHTGPARSVLCLWMTGEEKGLLGSEYYTEHPVFPLEQTVADINIDMIGRVDEHHDSPDYTYVIGSDRLSTELHAINENANRTYTHLNLDYTYNADDDPNRFYYRSDHYNFARNGIPAIFYFSGVHADYHRPTDTPDKIMYEKAIRIAQLAFYTAWDLANRPTRIKVDVVGRN